MNKIRFRIIEELYQFGNTQTAIAENLGFTRQAIWRWMNGKAVPDIESLVKLHNAGCDIVYIVTGERTRGGDTRA